MADFGLRLGADAGLLGSLSSRGADGADGADGRAPVGIVGPSVPTISPSLRDLEILILVGG